MTVEFSRKLSTALKQVNFTTALRPQIIKSNCIVYLWFSNSLAIDLMTETL